MKRIHPKINLFILLLIPGLLAAQGGGFGHFTVGMAGSGFGSLEKDLSVPSLMGLVTLPNSGTALGGGGFGVIGKHLLLGGKGYAGAFRTATSPNGTVDAGQAYGLFNFGYLNPLPKGFFGYVYGGIGGGGASAKIKNQSGNTWEFGGFQIKNGESGDLGTGGMAADCGLGIFRFLPSEAGGFLLGLQAGYTSGLSSQNWKNGDHVANNLSAWRPGLFYLTLCIGGGGIDKGK